MMLVSVVTGLLFWTALYFSRKRIVVLKRSSGTDQITFELSRIADALERLANNTAYVFDHQTLRLDCGSHLLMFIESSSAASTGGALHASKTVTFIPLPCPPLTNNSFIFKALAAALVHASRKICANGCVWPTVWAHTKESLDVAFDDAQLHRRQRRRSRNQLARRQSGGHCQIVFRSARRANVDLATVSFLLLQAPQLAKEFWVIEQLDPALHGKMLEVAKYLRSSV